MTIENYARHIAAIALHYGKVPMLLDQEQIHEYLFMLQKRVPTKVNFMGMARYEPQASKTGMTSYKMSVFTHL